MQMTSLTLFEQGDRGLRGCFLPILRRYIHELRANEAFTVLMRTYPDFAIDTIDVIARIDLRADKDAEDNDDDCEDTTDLILLNCFPCVRASWRHELNCLGCLKALGRNTDN